MKAYFALLSFAFTSTGEHRCHLRFHASNPMYIPANVLYACFEYRAGNSATEVLFLNPAIPSAVQQLIAYTFAAETIAFL